MFEDIIHIEIFGINESERIIINRLLIDGWKILSIVQASESNNYSFGQIILGADSSAFHKNNLSLLKAEEEDKVKNELEKLKNKELETLQESKKLKNISEFNKNKNFDSLSKDDLPF